MDKNNDSEEISLKELILKLRSGFNYIKSKWAIILLSGILGGALGLLYSIFKKPIYTATSTFVLEENKTGGLSQYASLASMAGIDIGGGGAGGIFQGDNILELYKSRVMIEKTLLTPVNINGKNELLIDRYIDYNKLRNKWKEKDHIVSISFNGNPEKFNRKQDSIITNIVELFNKKVLNVEKLDKKLSIIKVDVATSDELFSKAFNIKLVETVNDFYTQTKTKKSYQNVQVLQKQADSVKRILNYSIGGVASAIDAAPNANPLLQTLRVPSQKKQVDVQANSAIYSEIVKNLEISKISLRQETPLIQVIDDPVLPLPIDRLSKSKGVILGGFLGGFLIVVLISVRKFFDIILK
ncbi:Wzz/FepE/Etk N-terminal domain-containing protein [Mucilaginibacter arboris]|uniref:Lipopolysaccharide biosynthesis protein n=1 Tax=Mucilaginibacter arboris TaxID=2682090 RepID=A0A7K1SUL5_9SPHI|nr:Wzz/FepE/Etk N-terminal domain-containing protein [Mucilaginibacter arboris]MVN21015.1 lipopolysaccharide biosynthesis protein [Mucilaginibacter arboris]